MTVRENHGATNLDDFSFVVIVLCLLEETTHYLNNYRSALGPREANHRQPDSTADTAYHWLGKTTKEICGRISRYRVIHVESIMRTDLSDRFRDIQESMREALLKQPLGELKRNIPKEARRDKGGIPT